MNPSVASHIARRRRVIDDVKHILIHDLYVQREPDTIDVDAPLFATGMGLDSVDALELVVASETRFGIQLPQEVLRVCLRTLNTLVDAIVERQNVAQAAP